MTLHETKSSPIKQAASPDSTGWLSAKRKRALIPWLFLAPALIIFSWFKFIPMIQGLVMSFYKVNFNQSNEWVGLDNFTRAFADAELHAAVVNTLLYVVVTMFAAAIWRFPRHAAGRPGAPSALYSNRHLFTGGYQRGDCRRNVAHFV